MAKKKSKSTDPADAVTREEPIAPSDTTVTVAFDDAIPGACMLAGTSLVLMPGDNSLAPKTVDALKSHPIGERCRVDGARLKKPKPAKD
jgi:hypothetical protein